MNSKVLNTVKAHGMLKKGDNVVVALSGGADSVVLLDVLLKLRAELGIKIFAAHVNHNLRGEESMRDEAFVRRLCEERCVELFVRSVDVNAICKKSGESFELAGRRVRYDFFDEICEDAGAVVATAHTLSDSAETALFNIARGTSLSGLCSIPYKRGRVIRPLLDVTRAEVEAYAKANNLEFVNDSTNFDAEICSRNKIRHGAVPVLKEVNQSFEQNFMKLRKHLLQVEDFMKENAKELLKKAEFGFGYDCDIICKAHSAVRAYAIKLLLEKSGAKAEQKHIELIEKILDTSGAVNLHGGFTAVAAQRVLRITEEKELEKADFPLTVNKEFYINNKIYSFKELSQEEIVYKKLSTLCIGCDKISLSTNIRNRRQGDRFSLPKRGISKDLRKLQNELKIPFEQRDTLLLVENDGSVLWAEGIGVSAKGLYTGGNGILIEIREEA